MRDTPILLEWLAGIEALWRQIWLPLNNGEAPLSLTYQSIPCNVPSCPIFVDKLQPLDR